MSMVLMTGHGEYGAVILKVFHFHQQSSKKMGLIPKCHEKATSSILMIQQQLFADTSISNASVVDGKYLSKLKGFQIQL